MYEHKTNNSLATLGKPQGYFYMDISDLSKLSLCGYIKQESFAERESTYVEVQYPLIIGSEEPTSNKTEVFWFTPSGLYNLQKYFPWNWILYTDGDMFEKGPSYFLNADELQMSDSVVYMSKFYTAANLKSQLDLNVLNPDIEHTFEVSKIDNPGIVNDFVFTVWVPAPVLDVMHLLTYDPAKEDMKVLDYTYTYRQFLQGIYSMSPKDVQTLSVSPQVWTVLDQHGWMDLTDPDTVQLIVAVYGQDVVTNALSAGYRYIWHDFNLVAIVPDLHSVSNDDNKCGLLFGVKSLPDFPISLTVWFYDYYAEYDFRWILFD